MRSLPGVNDMKSSCNSIYLLLCLLLFTGSLPCLTYAADEELGCNGNGSASQSMCNGKAMADTNGGYALYLGQITPVAGTGDGATALLAASSMTPYADLPYAMLSSSSQTSMFGLIVTFTATVISHFSVPTGTITLMDGSLVIASGPLDKGVFTYQTSTLIAGTHNVSAVYSGDNNYPGTTTAAVQVVQKAPAAISILFADNSTMNGSTYHEPVTVSVTATSAYGIPQGIVSIKDGSTHLGSTVLINGTASFTTNQLSFGSHALSAEYNGNVNFMAATTTTPVQLSVAKVTSDITWSTPAAITYRTPLTAKQLNAMAVIPGTVSVIPGSFSYNPSKGAILPAGMQTLWVTFTPTDTANYTTATKGVSLTVNPWPVALSGDANANGAVSIAETLAAIDMFLGKQTISTSVDTDAPIGTVTAHEVQKVANAYSLDNSGVERLPDGTNTQLYQRGSRLVFASVGRFDIADGGDNGSSDIQPISGGITISQNNNKIASFPVINGAWYGEFPAAFVSYPGVTVTFAKKDGTVVEYDVPLPIPYPAATLIKGDDVTLDDAAWSRYQGYMRYSGIVPANEMFTNRHKNILDALVNPSLPEQSLLFPPPGQSPTLEELDALNSLDPADIQAEYLRIYSVLNEVQIKSFNDLNSFGKALFDARLKLYKLYDEMNAGLYGVLSNRVLAHETMNLLFDRGVPYGNWGQLASVPSGKLQALNKYYEGGYDPSSGFTPTKRLPIDWAITFANAEATGHALSDITTAAAKTEYKSAFLYDLSSANTFKLTDATGYFLPKKQRYAVIADLGVAKIIVDVARMTSLVAPLQVMHYIVDTVFTDADLSSVSATIHYLIQVLPVELINMILKFGLNLAPPLTEAELLELYNGYLQKSDSGGQAQLDFVNSYLIKRSADVEYANKLWVNGGFASYFEAESSPNQLLHIPRNIKYSDAELTVIERLKTLGVIESQKLNQTFAELLKDSGKPNVAVAEAGDQALRLQMATKTVLTAISDTSDPAKQKLRIALIKKAQAIELKSDGLTFYIDNNVDNKEIVKNIVIPIATANNPNGNTLELVVTYADGGREVVIYSNSINSGSTYEAATFVLKSDAMNNSPALDWLELISNELKHAAQYYNLMGGREPGNLRNFITVVSGVSVARLYNGTTTAMPARELLSYYVSSIIGGDYATNAILAPLKAVIDVNPGAQILQLRDAVWYLNNNYALGDFTDSLPLQNILKNAYVNMAFPETETNRVGERYQLLLAGDDWWNSTGCCWFCYCTGHTLSHGMTEIIGLMDTFEKKTIKVSPEVIVPERGWDAWYIDADQAAKNLRDKTIIQAQTDLLLKSWYVVEKGPGAAVNLTFDSSPTTDWKQIVSDSETAVREYRTQYIPNRKDVLLQNILRFIMGDSTITEARANEIYANLLSTFKDYIPHSTDRANKPSVKSPAVYVTKDDEPEGYTISEATLRLLQAIKNNSNAMNCLLSSTTMSSDDIKAIARNAKIVPPDKVIIDMIGTLSADPLSLTAEPLAFMAIQAKLKNIYHRPIADAEVAILLAEIQAKYASLLSYQEYGKVGMMTYMVLSYLSLAQDRNLFPANLGIYDLPDAISYTAIKDASGNDVNAFIMHKLVNAYSRITVTFAMNGQVSSQAINGKLTALKSYGQNDPPKNYFITSGFSVDETGASSDSYSDMMKNRIHMPMPDKYDAYNQWKIVEKIVESVVISMVTGNIFSFLSTALGIGDLYQLYNTCKNYETILKAAATNQLQNLLTAYLSDKIPGDWLATYQNINTWANTTLQGVLSTIDSYSATYHELEKNVTGFIDNLKQNLLDNNRELIAQANLMKQQFDTQKSFYLSTVDNLQSIGIDQAKTWLSNQNINFSGNLDGMKFEIGKFSGYQNDWMASVSFTTSINLDIATQDLFRLLSVAPPKPSCKSSGSKDNSYASVIDNNELVKVMTSCMSSNKLWDDYVNCNESIRTSFANNHNNVKIVNDRDLYVACDDNNNYNENLEILLSLAAMDIYSINEFGGPNPFRTLQNNAGFAGGYPVNFDIAVPVIDNGNGKVFLKEKIGMQAGVTAKKINDDTFVVAIGFRGTEPEKNTDLFVDDILKGALSLPFDYVMGHVYASELNYIITKSCEINQTVDNVLDFIVGGTTQLARWRSEVDAPVVHGGFAGQIKSFIDRECGIQVPLLGDTLLNVVSKKSNNVYYLIYGHSLGGALANLYGAILKERGIRSDHIIIYGFEDPGIGNDAFKHKFKNMNSYSFRNRYDIVPLAPYVNHYGQYGNRFLFYEGANGYYKEPGLEELILCFDIGKNDLSFTRHVNAPVPQAFFDWGSDTLANVLRKNYGDSAFQGCKPR